LPSRFRKKQGVITCKINRGVIIGYATSRCLTNEFEPKDESDQQDEEDDDARYHHTLLVHAYSSSSGGQALCLYRLTEVNIPSNHLLECTGSTIN
jgi:hypothetical protein